MNSLEEVRNIPVGRSKDLERIVSGSSRLFATREVQSFAAVALEQLIDILPFGGCGLVCILGSQPSRANEILILAGTGRYAEAAGLDLKAILDNEERAITRRRAASTQPAQSGSVRIELPAGRAEGAWGVTS